MGKSVSGSDLEVGFAKLQGEDFEYYMHTYSITLGRNSKKYSVDVDLSSLGGGMNISRNHARIFYDFTRRRFALEVLGRNGCVVEGVLHLPGNPSIKLDSQDLLQIGDKEFYFLLPVRSVLGGSIGPRNVVSARASAGTVVPYQQSRSGLSSGSGKKGGKGREYLEEYDDDEEDDEDDNNRSSGKKSRRERYEGHGGSATASIERKREGRKRVDREADDQQVLQLEEEDVVSSVATVLSDLCGPREWMPMEKLHSVILETYGNVWHHSRVKRYLTLDEWAIPEAKDKAWYGLLRLLRKYSEHFVINTKSRGRVTLEYVSLVSPDS